MSAAVPGVSSVRIDGLRRMVGDLRRSVDFYCGALGFEPAADHMASTAHMSRLCLGAQHIDLVAIDAAAGLPVWVNAPDPRFQHAAIVTDDMEASWHRLTAHAAVAISRDGPQRLPSNTGGVTAFKFRDPDGHPLELIEFPPGAGNPRWQVGRAGSPTLGIDHFALVVESIERSIAFFAAFGFRIGGRGVNRGVEQDRLDGLDDVCVDVVSLEPGCGSPTPHLELLGYRQPTFARRGDCVGMETEPRGRDEIVWLAEHPQGADDSARRVHDADGHCFVIEPSASPRPVIT